MSNYWKNTPRGPIAGGNWSNGSYAGLFCFNLNYRNGAEFPPFACSLLPAPKKNHSEYPDYIPKRWIHLSKHAKKARTRKKWKHEIARTIELHNKRSKGANA